MTKWVIKEFDNVEVPDQEIGLFYSSEAYVIRWAFTITVSRPEIINFECIVSAYYHVHKLKLLKQLGMCACVRLCLGK